MSSRVYFCKRDITSNNLKCKRFSYYSPNILRDPIYIQTLDWIIVEVDKQSPPHKDKEEIEKVSTYKVEDIN